MFRAQEHHDQSTHRVTNHHGLEDLELVHHRKHILRNGLDGDRLAGVFRASRSVCVKSDAAVAGGQIGNDGVVEVLG